MKVSKISTGLLLGLMLLLSTSASAATNTSKNKGSLNIQAPITVNGTRLAVGNYQLTWQGTSAEVELNILQSHKVVATVPARLVDLARPARGDRYGTRKLEDGSTSLTEIGFDGKKYELAIGRGSAATDQNAMGSQK